MDTNRIFVLTTILVLGTVSVSRSQGSSIDCSFRPVNNQSLVEKAHRYFDEDSDVKIVEYVISINVSSSSSLDWSKYSDSESFQPWRWFRTQGTGSSRLLLSFYFYYGLFRDYLTFDTRNVQVTLNPVPEGCMKNVPKGELDRILRDYLLRDFDINPKAVRHPYTPSDDVSMCTMYLHDVDGWGRLTYRCCKYDDDDDTNQSKECDDVYNDGWVWALRALIFTFTLYVFLQLPFILPGGHRVSTYEYSPNEEIEFNIVMTSYPDSFSNIKNSATLQSHEWRRMLAFNTEVDQLEKEVVYGAHVKRADCLVNNNKMAQRNESPVRFSKSFFDTFVLCKFKRNSPVDECCHTSICGEMCCRGTCCPSWYAWLRALRVILVMSVLALPALPAFYAAAADGLEYQELDEAHGDRGLLRTFNFYPGKIIGRTSVGIIAFMYVLNTVILVLDGATDRRLAKLYGEVVETTKRNTSLRRKTKTAKVVVKRYTRPLQKYGIYGLPFFLVVFCFFPVILIVLYVVDSPTASLITHATRKLLERLNIISRTDLQADEKLLSFCKIFWFLISMVFVCSVVALGINFLVHVIAMIIVEIVVDASVVYQILPVVFYLLFYIRDSFHRAAEKYRKYLDAVIRSLVSREEERLQRETRNTWPLEKNTMIKVSPGLSKQAGGSKDATPSSAAESVPEIVVAPSVSVDASGPGVRTPLFEVYRGALRMRLQRVVMFLSKEEVVGTPKKFLFQLCDMECCGVPGRLEENFILACFDFLKVAAFLLFVFIAVMAYGSIYSISPTNHLFITLVTGLVPLVLRNIFKDKDEDAMLDNTSFRFESQLDQEIQSFIQSWELKDLHIDNIQRKAEGSDVTNEQPIKSTLTTSRMANHRQPVNKSFLSMLILDLNESSPSPSDDRREKRTSSSGSDNNASRQRSTKVGNSSSICCGGGGGGIENGSDADNVDSKKKKDTGKRATTRYVDEESRYRKENKVTGKSVSWNQENDYEDKYHKLPSSHTGKWKRKKKRQVFNNADDSIPAREMEDFGVGDAREQGSSSGGGIGGRAGPVVVEVPMERPHLRRHDSSKDFRRFTTPPASFSGGGQGRPEGDN